MFFRKSKKTVQSPAARLRAWDEKTTGVIAAWNHFDVKVTSVTKRNGFGRTHENENMREPDGFEASGIITYPKYMIVSLSFEKSEGFGGWFYNVFNSPQDSPGTGIPMLEIYLADPERLFAHALHEALKTAILCGRRYTGARMWKRKGDGIMTKTDIEHDYSYESRYPIIGAYIWSEAESVNLPPWARPMASDGFSIENMPERYDLRL
jgi:hypothetical protein